MENWDNENGDEDKDRKYVGEIENGLPNGQGTYTWPEGRKCVGEYKDGKPNDQGIFTDPNGTMYVGNTRMGKNMVKEHTLYLMDINQ